MTRRETPFATHGELIVVSARVTGPRGTMTVPLVLDTGAVYTTITPQVAQNAPLAAAEALHQAADGAFDRAVEVQKDETLKAWYSYKAQLAFGSTATGGPTSTG